MSQERRSGQPGDDAPASEARPRIVGYDLARSLAILGMVVVHFGLVLSDGDFANAGALGWFVDSLDGRAAATFVVLAGVGLTLRSAKTLSAGDVAAERRVLTRRGVFLLATGFLNLIIWPGDILRVYGVSILLAAWFITASSRVLLAIATAFIAGFVLLFLRFDYDTHWEWETMTYHGLWTTGGISRNLFYDGFRSVFPWTGFLFFGMWLGRQRPENPNVCRRCLWWGIGVFLVTELASWVLVRLAQRRAGLDEELAVALFGTVSMPPLPLFVASAVGFAVATIAASLWIAERFGGNVILRAFVATGQMAFTWYVAHIVFGLGTVVELGLEGSQSLPVAVVSGLAFFAVAAMLSLWWRSRGARGPLEWLMRRVAG